MKIPRLGNTIEDRVIEEASRASLVTGEKIIDLKSLASMKGQNAWRVGLALQKKGFGTLLEIGGSDDWDYHFSLKSGGFEHGSEVRKCVEAQTFKGRIQSINRNAVNAVAASLAAIAAIVAAYYSYLSFVSQHAQTH